MAEELCTVAAELAAASAVVPAEPAASAAAWAEPDASAAASAEPGALAAASVEPGALAAALVEPAALAEPGELAEVDSAVEADPAGKHSLPPDASCV